MMYAAVISELVHTEPDRVHTIVYFTTVYELPRRIELYCGNMASAHDMSPFGHTTTPRMSMSPIMDLLSGVRPMDTRDIQASIGHRFR